LRHVFAGSPGAFTPISIVARCRSTSGKRHDERRQTPDERHLAIDEGHGTLASDMAIILLFLLGVGNFAMHKAVIESHHPLLGQMPWFFHMLGGRFSLLVEFVVLLGAMLMVDGGAMAWAWGYAGYSLLNGISAWLILTDRV
jgi:hypothetical protein